MTESFKTVYSLIWGQCIELLKTELESLKKFEAIENTKAGGVKCLHDAVVA